MRKVKSNYNANGSCRVLRFLFLIVFLLSIVPLNAFANVENFYFDSFEADYYLSQDAEGVSHLKVVENLTAVFPNYNQNKGICRYIPFTNQNNLNVTLPDLNESNITLTRNGLEEPIYSIEKEGTSYKVCTGDESYVTGRQLYTLTYEFKRVITNFDYHQELYWDTNGNGWMQTFNKLTARVHFVDEKIKNAYDKEKGCYVGRYKEIGSERCTISEIEDGLEFSTGKLYSNENLTFYIEFVADTFVVPAPEKNYTLVIIMVAFGIICILCLISPFKKFLKTREKANYYKELFVRPEYQPNKDYNVAEMAEIYIGEKKDAKVAVMLDMIVRGKITLIKSEGTGKIFKRDKWSVKVKDLSGVSEEGMILLKILKGGLEPKEGDEIEIKTRTANSTLVSLGRKYDKVVKSALKQDGLVESDYEKKESGPGIVAGMILAMIAFSFGMSIIADLFDALVDESGELKLVGDVVGRHEFLPVLLITLAVAIIAYKFFKSRTTKFLYRTKKGLEASRYMDGLKLYIGMAEKDRLAFLQSVKGADTSPEGVVHLYEKLLPYAAVLGLEKTWMNELEKYYKLQEVETPDWYHSNFATYNMLTAVNTAASTVRSSTTYASSGGGSSSGFSGGGGGGFSGGGGGGGGGGGR